MNRRTSAALVLVAVLGLAGAVLVLARDRGSVQPAANPTESPTAPDAVPAADLRAADLDAAPERIALEVDRKLDRNAMATPPDDDGAPNRATHRISGRVIGLDGHPDGGVQVELLAAGSTRYHLLDGELDRAVTDPDGSFAFRAVDPGLYVVIADNWLFDASNAFAVVEVDELPTEGLELHLREFGAIRAAVIDARGSHVGDAFVELIADDGQPLPLMALGWSVANTGLTGSVRLEGVSAGPTRVRARAGTRSSAIETVDVPAGGVAQVILHID